MTAVTWLIGYASFYRDPPEYNQGFPENAVRAAPLVCVAQMRQEALDAIGNRRRALDHFPESRMDEG